MSDGTITFEQVDSLMAELATKEEEKESIADSLKAKNKEITTLELRITELLKSLERNDYTCKYGKVAFKEVFNIKMPSDDNKHLLWKWMREEGIFERYATVHAVSLKSLFKSQRDLAIENGEDPITFALPGMEPATIFEKLDFKPIKGKTNVPTEE